MKTRIIVAAIGLPLLLAIVLFLPTWATAIVVAAMAVIAVHELLQTAGFVKQPRIQIYTMLIAGYLSIWSWMGCPQALGMAALLGYCALLFGEMLAAHTKLKFQSICIAMFSGLVIPLLMTSLVRILIMDNGRYYIMIAFILAFTSDSGAYFAGRLFGKHKLAPIISPKKTVEGAVGGIVCAVLFMALYGLLLQFAFHFQVHFSYAIVYGLLGSVASIVGDLAFSVIKRQVQLKDYGNLLPGHGGILDRFDSMTMVAPLTEVLLLLLPFAVRV